MVLGLILVAGCIGAQPTHELLLPQARHITGVVVDSEGKPVVGARIDHTTDRRHEIQTDSRGRFEVDTRAPTFVVRRAGFRGELIHSQDVSELHVALQKLSEKRQFPVCSDTGQYESVAGWAASFQFPRIPGVKVGRQGSDADYAERYYYVKTRQGPKGIKHGMGPTWSLGMPVDVDVWRSKKYEEVRYDAGVVPVIDARGQLANGNRWRYLGMVGESVSYSDVNEATAKILDVFLDGACLGRRGRPALRPSPETRLHVERDTLAAVVCSVIGQSIPSR